MQQTNPITQLASTEAALVRGIDQAAARLEQVGTVHLDAALDRLERARQQTMARLQAGAARYRQIVEELATAFNANTEAVREDVAASTLPLLGLPGPMDEIDLDWDGSTPFDREDVAEETPIQTAACSPVEPARDDRVIPEEQPARPRRKRRGQ